MANFQKAMLGLVLVCSMSLAGARKLVAAGQEPSSAITAEMSPIRKVITLIEEMKVVVDKEATEDLAAYDKYMCWCQTNEKEKTAAIEEAQARIEELNAFVEEATAKIGQLKTEIGSLEQDIAEDTDALNTAVATRDKEFAAFTAEEADMKETKGLLAEAIEVLSKVQLLQKGGKASGADQARARAALIQVQEKVRHVLPHTRFASVMQKDLFDMFGSISDASRGLRGASFEQSSLLPWEKTEEQIGMEAKPNDLKGAAANSKSYNSRSGGILGLLAGMNDQFIADLASAQKQDFEAEVSFQSLKAAKLGEIEVGSKAKESKEADLADTLDQAAKAKEDRESTTAAMEADQGFLANMQKDCKSEDEQYKARSKTRSEEVVALAETIKILTEDESRDLFGKSVTLLQLSGSSVKASSEAALVQDRAMERAMQKIAAVARRHQNWALVSLAVRTGLDAFSKVKEVMDKMLVELANQQKDESAKKEFCNKDLDSTEDSIKVAGNTKEDLDEKHLRIVNTLEALSRNIDDIKAEEADMQVSLKQAGEQRKAENQVFQQSVMDQRATINILNKAQQRLKMFYTPALVEIHAHQPGRAVAPKPDTPGDYSKSAGAGGVMQLLAKIVENAEVAEKELTMDEQQSQALYAEFVKVTTATIEADRAAISDKAGLTAQAEADKSETQEAQLGNDQELGKLNDLLKAQHLDCDWLIKYYDIRQQARAEEIDAINDAKAVLSGANFGK
mmetsp:Transcript_23601/g.60149  ORF Transcript_23601/g.60149 Transcript_23601/m.60149 type:complete len:736 (+) Transcript_23601:76-2283(+)